MSTTSSASVTRDDIRSVSPALEKYATTTIQEGLWKRPVLTPRDRSIVTVATLIARNQAVDMPRHIALALDNGVKPGEISEIITHLAFYSGWANAMSAVAVTKDIIAQRGIGADQLPAASPQPLPLNEAAEAQRATSIQQNFGQVAPGVLQYTTDRRGVISSKSETARRRGALEDESKAGSAALEIIERLGIGPRRIGMI